MINIPWIRVLTVTLSSDSGASMTIGGVGSDHFTIDVVCNCYLAAAKDEAVIKISNLTYDKVLRIIQGKFYNVTVEAGYQNKTVYTVFDGGVLYVSNELTEQKTNTVIILCTSKLIAKFGQKKLNLTLNSGINLYSAVSFIAKRAGITGAKIPSGLSRYVVDQYFTLRNSSMQSYLDYVEQSYADVSVSPDSSIDASKNTTFNLFTSQSSRTVNVNNSIIDFSAGYPRLTNSGLTLTVIPTFKFVCGDILKIDNSIIDISASGRRESDANYGNFLNSNGLYRLKQISYNLKNRDSEFSTKLVCMSNAIFEEGGK